jgi:hypothetical protein
VTATEAVLGETYFTDRAADETVDAGTTMVNESDPLPAGAAVAAGDAGAAPIVAGGLAAPPPPPPPQPASSSAGTPKNARSGNRCARPSIMVVPPHEAISGGRSRSCVGYVTTARFEL